MLTHKLNTNFRLLMVMDENIEKDVLRVLSKFNQSVVSSPNFAHKLPVPPSCTFLRVPQKYLPLFLPKKTALK